MASKQWHLDVIAEIVKRLPVKSIVKCMCVRKEWKDLIIGQEFIRAHLAHTLNPPRSNFLALQLLPDREEIFALYSYCGNNSRPLRTFFPFDIEKHGTVHIRVIGSMHGLLCISVADNYFNSFIWNPSINRYLEIPGSCCQFSMADESRYAVLGFGFDSLLNDYKLMRMVFGQGKESDEHHICLQVGIYSLKQRGWKELDPKKVNPYYIELWQVGADSGNAIHWVARDQNEKNALLSFDMNSECFHITELPQELADASAEWLHISKSNGSLAIFHHVGHVRSTCGVWCDGFEYCDIWVKEESNPWTNTCTINLGDLILAVNVGDLVLTGVKEWRENRVILMVHSTREGNNEHRLVYYDILTSQIEDFVIEDMTCLLQGGAFCESLLLLNEDDTVSEIGEELRRFADVSDEESD